MCYLIQFVLIKCTLWLGIQKSRTLETLRLYQLGLDLQPGMPHLQ